MRENAERFLTDLRCAQIFTTRIEMPLLTGWNAVDGPLVDDGILYSRLDSAYGSDEIAEVLISGKSAETNPYLVDGQGFINFEVISEDSETSVGVPGAYAAGVTLHIFTERSGTSPAALAYLTAALILLVLGGIGGLAGGCGVRQRTEAPTRSAG